MANSFEDRFMEIQERMVKLCLEYVDFQVEKVYMYVSNEGGALFFKPFYLVNGHIVKMGEVNKAFRSGQVPVDDSPLRQVQVMKLGVDDLEDIIKLCEENGTEAPSEMKIVYDLGEDKLIADYKYIESPLEREDLAADDKFERWIREEGSELLLR